MTKFGFFMILKTKTILIFLKSQKSGSKYKYLPIQSERCVSCILKKQLTEDKAIIIKTMEATTPELGPVGFWSPKSSSFSGSDSIVVEEAARNFLSPRPSVKQSGAPYFFVQHASSRP